MKTINRENWLALINRARGLSGSLRGGRSQRSVCAKVSGGLVLQAGRRPERGRYVARSACCEPAFLQLRVY
jgi:hypothetical protein